MEEIIQSTIPEAKTVRDIIDNVVCKQLIQVHTCDGKIEPVGKKPPPKPICLDSELTVAEGCAALAENKISSAPIYDASKGGFIGMLDYRDLVAYVLSVFQKLPLRPESFNSDEDSSPDNIADVISKSSGDKTDIPIRLVANLSHMNPLIPAKATDPVSHAVELMVEHKMHRVVILEEKDSAAHFSGILSQSTVAALIATKIGKLGGSKSPLSRVDWELGNQTLEDLGLVRGGVIGVSPTDSVLEALSVMYQNCISSVAIVRYIEEGPILLGSIGMTDIKEILSAPRGWRRLYENALDFFVSIRSSQGLDSGNDKMPSFTVRPQSSLISAIEKIAATKAHRVWVVNNFNIVVGVVSLSDIMPFFLK